jgi:2Fe-2S ferredoxin
VIKVINLTFIDHTGNERVIEANAGESVMRAAISNNISQILGDCGGSLACATCHVHVHAEWRERVGQPGEAEAAMLEMAIDPDEASRLSCQILLNDDLNGLVINLPASQI